MKKLFTFRHLCELITVVALLPTVCNAEVYLNGVNQASGISSGVLSVIVAALPAAGSPGRIRQVTDGASGTDCTVGSGATTLMCMDDGSNWVAVAGAGDVLGANNLSDIANADTALDNLGATAIGKNILKAADEATFKSTVNLEAGADFNAFSEYLADIAGLSPVANNLLGWNAAGTDIENKASINIQFLSSIEFEGATANDYEVTFTVDDPTADVSWNVPYSNAVKSASKATGYTIGTDHASEAYGGVIYVTSAATITAPAVVAGMSFTVITIGATAVSVDVNAADKMYLDGVLLDDGDKATNTSTTGDILHCSYYSADGWYCGSGSPDGDHWTDGGA